jgi:hypothetical protein
MLRTAQKIGMVACAFDLLMRSAALGRLMG